MHTRAGVLWLTAVLAPALLVSNPLYLLQVTAAAAAVYAGVRGRGPAARGWGAFLRFGLVLVGFAVVVQPLLVSTGDTLLATLPALRLGALELGGRVTLESLVYGAGHGLALAAVLLAFATFNVAVDPYQLVRSVPRFLYRSGIVLSIALGFVPQTLVAQREIREAQALRGHRFRGVRDLVPLLVALLAEGLERSIDLAEAMEARGFGAGEDEPAAARGLRAALAAGLGLALAGAALATAAPRPGGGLRTAGTGLAAAGVVTLVLTLAAVARRVRRSRYRTERWRRRDTLVAATALASLAGLAAAWWGGAELFYYPYPRLTVPPLSPWVAAALALLAAPALIAGGGSSGGDG